MQTLPADLIRLYTVTAMPPWSFHLLSAFSLSQRHLHKTLWGSNDLWQHLTRRDLTRRHQLSCHDSQKALQRITEAVTLAAALARAIKHEYEIAIEYFITRQSLCNYTSSTYLELGCIAATTGNVSNYLLIANYFTLTPYSILSSAVGSGSAVMVATVLQHLHDHCEPYIQSEDHLISEVEHNSYHNELAAGMCEVFRHPLADTRRETAQIIALLLKAGANFTHSFFNSDFPIDDMSPIDYALQTSLENVLYLIKKDVMLPISAMQTACAVTEDNGEIIKFLQTCGPFQLPTYVSDVNKKYID